MCQRGPAPGVACVLVGYVEQRGWGRTGWLPPRGEQRTLLSQLPSQSPKGLWQGHLSGDGPPPSCDWPIFSPTLEELLVPSQETWCQARPPGGQGRGTGPDKSLEFYVTEVITATEQLSLCLSLGWAWLRPQPVVGSTVRGEGSVCQSEERGSRWGAMAGVRPREAGLCIQGLSCSVAMQGVASLWVDPEAQKLDEGGGPSHSGPGPLPELRERRGVLPPFAASCPSPSLCNQWAPVCFGRGQGERVGSGQLGCTSSGGSQRCALMLTHCCVTLGMTFILSGSWCPYGNQISQHV